MDPALLRLSRAYRRRNHERDRDEAREDLLDLYALYTGGEPYVPEQKLGKLDEGLASSVAFAARTTAQVLKLGPLRHPAGMLVRQGVRRSQEATKLMAWVRDDRKTLARLLKHKHRR